MLQTPHYNIHNVLLLSNDRNWRTKHCKTAKFLRRRQISIYTVVYEAPGYKMMSSDKVAVQPEVGSQANTTNKQQSQLAALESQTRQLTLVEQLGGRAPLHSGALPNMILSGPPISANSNDTEDVCTYAIINEDHTLGNAVRYMLSRDKRVMVAGYSIPHPSEQKIHLRVQTFEQIPTATVLKDSLSNIIDVSDHILDTFDAAEKTFANKMHDR